MKNIEIDRISFLKQYKDIALSVFKSFKIIDGVFKQQDWDVLFLPYDVFLTELEIYAFREMLIYAGDQKYIISDIERRPYHQNNLIIDISKNSPFLEELNHGSLGVFSCILFGESKSWGLFIDRANEVRLLGASTDILDHFVTKGGGQEALYKEFKKFATETWTTSLIPFSEGKKILNRYNWDISLKK